MGIESSGLPQGGPFCLVVPRRGIGCWSTRGWEGGVRGYTRLLRRQVCPVEHPRFRYASGGQGAMKRWPLASPRSRGASPPLDPQRFMRGVPVASASLRRKAPPGDLPPVTPMRTKLSLAWQSEGAFIYRRPAPHSIAGQLPCGAGAPWAICPAECVCAWNSRWHGNAGVPLPPLLLRRASAMPELPPRKSSAAISGCGCVSPYKGFLRQIHKSEHARIFSRVMRHDHVSSLAAYAGGL